MKKIVLFVLIFVILGAGVFLLVDKFYLHMVFKVSESSEKIEVAKTIETFNTSGVTPGSCLILEEKYCELGKLTYDDTNKMGYFSYKIPKDTIVFSPIDGYYSIITNNTNNRSFFIRESKVVDAGDSVLQYQISFKGLLSPSVKETSKGSVEISKEEVIGKTSSDESILVLLTQRISLDENSQMVSSFSLTDLKKFPSN